MSIVLALPKRCRCQRSLPTVLTVLTIDPKRTPLMGTEFDILEGVTMSHVHPPDKLDGFKKSDLAALCIPDGGHKVLVHDN